MTIYLYVKTHNKTGLKYLGKTTKADPHKYTGSGTRWLNHLKKHGYDYTTEIVRECQTETELVEWGLYYSNLWNVVESTEWANLKEEAGDGGSHGELTRQRMSDSKKGTTPWNKGKTGVYSDETKKKISEANQRRTHSEETKQKMSAADRSSYKRTVPVSEETKQKLSAAMKGRESPTKGKQWSDEQRAALSLRRKGRQCPTKGMKREYRPDGTFYFVKP